jgi:small acid-soluble spore protein N (minor)
MTCHLRGNTPKRGGIVMSNMKGQHPKRFKPDHIGTQSRGFGGNKGKTMQDTSGKHAQVIQTKGE